MGATARLNGGVTMIGPGPDDKIYPVVKLATVLNALADEGVSMEDALAGVRLSKGAISSPATRVSLNQIIECYRNADRIAHDRHFAYHAGLRFHVSAYGMYGFAILSSMNYRQTTHFALKYHQLATPLSEIHFEEESGCGIWTLTPLSSSKWISLSGIHFEEESGCGIWTLTPLPHSRVNARLYKFLVEMQFGIILSLHRDVMGPSFAARELHVTYGPTDGARKYPNIFRCPVLFDQSENKFIFDAAWLDGTPKVGNEITYSTVIGLCDGLMEEFELRIGLVGQVRQVLLANLMRPMSFSDIAGHLNMSGRTLRRKLREENTSFRRLADDLRMQMPIKNMPD